MEDAQAPAVQGRIECQEPQHWLSEFVEAVRARDTDAGRSLFAEEVVGYGTLTPRMLGLDDLVDRQWRPTWERVRTWRVTEVDVVEQTDGLAVLAVCWERVNNDDHAVVHGRATLVLHRGAEKQWRCIHSHFSADPAVVDPTRGRGRRRAD